MSWTYSMNPGTSPKDTVRYLIGDTNIDNPIVQDEEIQFNLAEVGNEPYRAASNTCYSLIHRPRPKREQERWWTLDFQISWRPSSTIRAFG